MTNHNKWSVIITEMIFFTLSMIYMILLLYFDFPRNMTIYLFGTEHEIIKTIVDVCIYIVVIVIGLSSIFVISKLLSFLCNYMIPLHKID